MTATAQAHTSSTTAVVSLIFGILSWVLLPVIGAIVAIVLGHMARAEIQRSNGMLEGDGLAVAGLVLGWTHIVLMIGAVLIAIVFLGGIIALIAAIAAAAAIG
jgi:hypothetical protein